MGAGLRQSGSSANRPEVRVDASCPFRRGLLNAVQTGVGVDAPDALVATPALCLLGCTPTVTAVRLPGIRTDRNTSAPSSRLFRLGRNGATMNHGRNDPSREAEAGSDVGGR